MKSIYFAVTFGVPFSAIAIFAYSQEQNISYGEMATYLALGIVATYLLRMFSVLLKKSHEAGARLTDKLLPSDSNDEIEDVVPEKVEENYLQMLLGLYFVGPFLTTAVAAIPAIFLAIPFSSLFGESLREAMFLISGSIVTAVWLVLVLKWWRVKITVPYIPVPIIWFTPLTFLIGVAYLFSS